MKKIISIVSAFLITNLVSANEPVIEVPPTPPTRGNAVGFGEPEPENPIDMHTSALLLAGVGLIASYAYFANRRKEKI